LEKGDERAGLLWLVPQTHSLAPDTVILIDIQFDNYSFSKLETCWASKLAEVGCPACSSVGAFALHGRYTKYYYQERIDILRIRCRRCGVTHALMPTFSLPGTSGGTKEVEEYLIKREAGDGRKAASEVFTDLGVGERYPKQLDRMLETAVSRAKALFPDAADDRLSGLEWIRAMTGEQDRPLWSLNRYALNHRYNCICFCRASIITFSSATARRASSHNRGSPGR